MTTVVILGPNLPASDATFHVHRAGCADITRSPVYRREEPWEIDVSSVREVVEAMFGPEAGSFYEEAGLEPDDPDAWRDYRSDFRFFPCVPVFPEH